MDRIKEVDSPKLLFAIKLPSQGCHFGFHFFTRSILHGGHTLFTARLFLSVLEYLDLFGLFKALANEENG